MKKIIEVSKYEFFHHVGKARFWLMLFGVPFAFLTIFALSVLFSFLSFDKSPVGYIDRANLISQPQSMPEKQNIFYKPNVTNARKPGKSAGFKLKTIA